MPIVNRRAQFPGQKLKMAVISSTGLLSLGQATGENNGEYVCTATRAGTYKQSSKSIFILLKESKGDSCQSCVKTKTGTCTDNSKMHGNKTIPFYTQTGSRAFLSHHKVTSTRVLEIHVYALKASFT